MDTATGDLYVTIMSQSCGVRSGVNSVMMEKSAKHGGVGDARPPPFTISTITYKVVVYALAERADTLHLFLPYPYIYSVGKTARRRWGWAVIHMTSSNL